MQQDGTLVLSKSGLPFVTHPDDFKFFNKDVPKVLKDYADKGYKIVIFRYRCSTCTYQARSNVHIDMFIDMTVMYLRPCRALWPLTRIFCCRAATRRALGSPWMARCLSSSGSGQRTFLQRFLIIALCVELMTGMLSVFMFLLSVAPESLSGPLALQMDVDATVLYAVGKDNFRKPGTGMWEYFVEHLNGGMVPGGTPSLLRFRLRNSSRCIGPADG